MIKVNKVVDKGGIVLLQETHILDKEQITLLTNHKVEISSFTSNSAGVITIFNNEYEKIHSFSDGSGRKLFTLIKVRNEQFLVVNIYSPNYHKKAIDFVEEVYIKILQILNDYPDTFVIVGGDFNSCMTSKDFLNRNKSKAETELTNAISNNNEMCGLIDSFRTTESAPGYTWNRGGCYSRLDYIYVSKELRNRLGAARVDWAFEKSDHAALSILIRIKEEIIKGKGITKVNTEILKDPQKVIQIRDELNYLITQIPNYWDGHMKLEYLKMSIRSTFAKYVGVERSEMRDNVKELEISLNNIEEMKLKLLSKVSIVSSVNNLDERLGKIETAKITIMNELDILRNKLTDKIDFQARAKWFEFGEKSSSG
jgi:exonuclease III